MARKTHGMTTVVAATLIVWLAAAVCFAAPQAAKGYLDYLDSYYKTGSAEDLMNARNSIKIELDASDALRFQSYYYNAEIVFLLALEELKRSPQDVALQEKLRGLMLQLYSRYLDAYYKIEPAQLRSTSVPGNTAFLIKDMLMAATFCPGANSFAPLVKNVLRRATRDSLYDAGNSYLASVNDMIALEHPNLFGIANFTKAVWVNDQFVGMKQDSAVKDSLRRMVNYYAAIASDTLKSPFALSISYFLLAETFANHENDMAWNYFRKCLDLAKSADLPTNGFYGRNYNRSVYTATCVAFLPTYASYLFAAGRHAEILNCAKYLIDKDMLDRGQIENVSREAVFWGEKSIRALQDAANYTSADGLFQQLKGFQEMLEPSNQLGNSE